MRNRRFIPAAILVALALPAAAQEKLPAGRTVVKLEAKPASVTLKHAFDYAQLLLSATLDNGDVIDVTRMAKLEPPNVVKVSATGQVRPAAEGGGAIKATACATSRLPSRWLSRV